MLYWPSMTAEEVGAFSNIVDVGEYHYSHRWQNRGLRDWDAMRCNRPPLKRVKLRRCISSERVAGELMAAAVWGGWVSGGVSHWRQSIR